MAIVCAQEETRNNMTTIQPLQQIKYIRMLKLCDVIKVNIQVDWQRTEYKVTILSSNVFIGCVPLSALSSVVLELNVVKIITTSIHLMHCVRTLRVWTYSMPIDVLYFVQKHLIFLIHCYDDKEIVLPLIRQLTDSLQSFNQREIVYYGFEFLK